MPRAEGRIFRMPKILYLHMYTYSHRQHPQPYLWRMSCEPWRQTSIEKTGSSSTYKRNAPMGTHEGLTEVDKAQLRAWNDFFFSSRRRHTISLRDWSSDVCSSD